MSENSTNIVNGRQMNNNSTTKLNRPQPVIDIVVIALAIPSLVIFALLLEANMKPDWDEQSSSRWTVYGLGFGLLLICLLVCCYVTHRMGACLWAGPLDDPDNNNPNISRINSEGNMGHFIDILPPSYESIMGFDVPPPPYSNCIFKIEHEINVKSEILEETSSHI